MHSSKNFVITRTIVLDELKSTLIECEHIPTGAKIIKLLNDDEENLFCLSFQTWPDSSNGVAHILEHTVLCGSKRFAIKDPFFSMTRRSLNTYMNALTGGDFTCYPAASQVPKDFYNLLEVYLDAVFYPRLEEKSFLQEGHRLEFLDMEDAKSPLTFKGIVYNEMKGAMSSKESRLSEEIMHALYPNITYGINSGGDPKDIPALTYQGLKEFHQKYYHPSRCLFFFYGNLPLEEELEFLEKNALSGVEKAPPLGALPKQQRFSKRKEITKEYPAQASDEDADKAMVALGYLTCSILSQTELLALNVCDILLSATDAAPLKMALLKSGLCKQADAFIDNEMSEVPYLIICKGCPENSGEKIEATVTKVLEQVVKDGFSEELIEGAISQLEMARSEITGGSSPYGLSLFFRSALLAQHGGKPEDGLKIHSLFKELRKKESSYFTGLIQTYFLDNQHVVRVLMRPDGQMAAREQKTEEERLEKIKCSLAKEQIETLIKTSRELAEFQEEVDNPNVLPKVSLNDVKHQTREFGLKTSKNGQLTVHTHTCFTNQMIYADLIFPLPKLDLEELLYLRLLAFLLPQIGCAGRNYQEHLDYLLEHTGGLSVFLDFCQMATDPDQMNPYLCIRAKALNRKADYLFPLIKELCTSADLSDHARIKECLMQHLNSLESSIQQNPLRYAMSLAASRFSKNGVIQNQCYGLRYYWRLKEIVAQFERDPNQFIAQLQKVQKKCLGLKNAELVLTVDEKAEQIVTKANYWELASICTKASDAWQCEIKNAQVKSQGRIINAPVAFTTHLFDSVSYTDADRAALSVAAEIMENQTLHPRIREQGGAYGAGAAASALAGYFYFYTYRDPNIASSLAAIEEAITKLCQTPCTPEQLEEAKLQIFQDLDTPLPPCSRGYTAFGRLRAGCTPEVRQTYRDQLFSVTPEAVQAAAIKHLQPGFARGITVAFTGKELLEKENKLLKEKLEEIAIDDERL